ncbi:MAG: hypothetical protein DKM50_08505 [Candidatus Margulisiibacteriota bacterium]|nr:MAG: hypothetical protein A2X43_11940 [Candidatus Margulisbacteria bacterium GWD2_39_127]PZM79491.1 MAG: hypothetical protein DKM50_08505 [Candidatus Margulisiibacteriota bacterium]HAR63838.1 hypothetical protein [Candidatus Margulisiibacteriota bacterium]HCT83633.1 hypothetical protein [Candidatus Margulisiibacteriota bacterium]HCY37836.1 hypothetical protein [Candidatus Margulisiibacteriota bacterium]
MNNNLKNNKTDKLRVAVHDYGGHPFSFDLSECLSEKGYKVLYIYTSSCKSPNAQMKKRHSLFKVKNIVCQEVKKELFLLRFFQESTYGDKVVSLLRKWKPDLIISSTTPLFAQRKISKWAKKSDVQSIFWFQDIISIAAKRILPLRIGMMGKWIALWMERMEMKVVHRSKAVVTISEDFNEVLRKWNVAEGKVVTIPNWAVIKKLPVKDKTNPWACKHGLSNKFCFLYSGTLGMKHNPELLLKLALHFKNDRDVRIIVVSEKMGAEWLKIKKVDYQLDNLIIFNFQPFDSFPEVLATADVLISILNKDASEFCVPSKVLSYLCAARPLLLAVSKENLVAKIVSQNQAGIVVYPEDIDSFLAAAQRLRLDNSLRDTMARNGRLYAEKTFDRQKISLRFELIINQLLDRPDTDHIEEPRVSANIPVYGKAT